MLNNLKYLIIDFPHNLIFQYGNKIVGYGLKLNYENDYPANTNKEYQKFINKLWEDESIESYQKITYWENLRHEERMHILSTKVFMVKCSGIFMLLNLIFQLTLKHPIPSMAFGCLVIVLFLATAVINRKRKNAHFEKGLSEILVEFLMKNLQKDEV